MKTGGWGRADWVMLWLAAALLCVLAGHAPARGSGAADQVAVETQTDTNNRPAGALPSSSTNADRFSVLFVPVILSASGQNNSLFTSELTLTNRGTEEATLHYTYTAHRAGGSGTATEVLAPGQQKIEPDALEYLRRLGMPIPPSGNRLGTLRVEVAGSSEVGVSVRTTTRVPEGRAGLAYPGIAAADGFQEAVYLCGLRQNSQDRSNLAFQHMGTPEEGPITLRTTVYSGELSDPTSRVLDDVTLPPGGFHQYNSILNRAGLDNGYVKVERVEGTAPFYAYGVINDNFNSDGSFVFPVTATSLMGAKGQTLPVIVETGKFTSELTVTNFSKEAKTFLFSFVADGLTTPDRTARFNLTIGAGQQRIIPDVIDTQLRQKGVEGVSASRGGLAGALFARVAGSDMSGIVIGARTSSSDGRGGHYGVFYHAAPDGEAFTKSVWVDGLQQNTVNRSNLALVNTGEMDGGDSLFTLEIYDGATGMLANTVTGLTVTAKGWRQINAVLADYAPGASQGYVRIRKISGNNPFLAYGVINDGGAPGQRSGDGAYLSATVTIIDPGSDAMKDREALEALYHATGGPDWRNRTNWLTAAPLSEWYGVTTDGNGRVTSLGLSHNGLSGTIPPALGQLARLERLGLGGNELRGAIPPQLGRLTQLESLSLGNNELNGPIPPELAGLTQLQNLFLVNNRLNGPIPPELGGLSHLQKLELRHNRLSGAIPLELGGLSHLQTLILGNNDLSGAIPPELGGLSNLQWLDLGANNLSGAIPLELGRLANLQWLDLGGNELSRGIPAQLGRLTKLKRLELTDNDLSGGVPPELSGLSNLQTLELRRNRLSGAIPKQLRQLSSLTLFDIRETQICIPTDRAFQAWLDMISKFFSTGLVCDGTRRVLFSASSYEVKEGETVTVSVRLVDQTGDPDWSAEITLTATPDGGAAAADYSGVPERVTITAPATEASFVVTAVKDDHFDHSETVVLGFRRPLPTGVTAGFPDTATVTIVDPGTEGVTDREVLEALYHATGGPGWRNRTHWLSDVPLSQWFGVGTDESGQVTGLALSQNTLSGTIPLSLSKLAQLESLDLGENRLTGEIPPELGGLAHLKELHFKLNDLSGTIPPELGRLTQLQVLNLFGNDLSGTIPPELGRLTQLQVLNLFGNDLSRGIPPELAGLNHLQTLWLGGNELSGTIPPELGRLTQLQDLFLAANNLSGEIPLELAGLTQLQELVLGSNELSGGIPPELAGLTNLKVLQLWGNDLSGTIPPELGGLTNLEWLNLGGNNVSGGIPPELAGLNHLQELNLGVNRLSGTIPPELGSLTHLQALYLGNNELSGGIPPELGGLTNLKVLYLFGNYLSGGIPPELAGLTNLEGLALGGNKLSGGIPPELGGLTNLEWLSLRGTRLSGEIPPELAQLTNLRQLTLDFSPHLTGVIPPGLQQLPLETLGLMASSVCVPEDAEFQEWLAGIKYFSPSGLTCGRPPATVPSIDIAVFYTPPARRVAGGTVEMEAVIDLMVAETNQAYLDGGVNQHLVLVAREEVEYQEESGGIFALGRFSSPSDGYMDEVHAIRDRSGADLVHLIADVTHVAGEAYLTGEYALTCANCDSSTFAHELGHNMGLSHDRYVERAAILPFSYGYVNQQAFADGAPESARWRTIMSYEDQCYDSSLSCNQLMRFSNPNQTYLGDPLGVPGDDRTSAVNGPADAVRMLNLTRHSVAGWRPRASRNQLTIPATLSQARPAVRTSRAAVAVPGASLFRGIAPSVGGVASRQTDGVPDRATLRRREVSVDIGRLARVPNGRGTALRLNLFDDVLLTGIIERRTPTYSGGFALSGGLVGVAGGTVTLVVNGTAVAGTVRIPGAIYRIRPAGAGRHAIMQIDPSQLLQGCEVVMRTSDPER